jgi:hypothetical protein
MKPINGALFYFFTVVFIPGLKAEDIEFAKKIAKKNRDTIDLINSYSCESRIIVSKENGEAHPEQKLFRSGSYWKNKDSFRFRYEKEDGSWHDGICKDGIMTGLSYTKNFSRNLNYLGRIIPAGEMVYNGLIQRSPNILAHGTDIEARMLFKIENMKPTNSPEKTDLYQTSYLEDLFAENFRIFKSCEVLNNGLTKIEFHVQQKYRHEFFLDPRLNYLIVKYEISPYVLCKETPLGKNTEVSDFAEEKPGIFFPRKSKQIFLVNNKIEKIEALTLSDLEVNEIGILRNLNFIFPKNIQVSDNIKGRLFKTLDNGIMEDLGELKKLKPPNLNTVNANPEQYTGPSIEEPHSNMFLYSASLFLLLIFVGFWFYLKK